MAKLPEFTVEGVLPAGDYELTLEQLRQSVLVVGPSDEAAWQSVVKVLRRRDRRILFGIEERNTGNH